MAQRTCGRFAIADCHECTAKGQVSGVRCQVGKNRSQETGVRIQDSGSGRAGGRYQVSGTRCQVPGVRCQVSGARCQVAAGRCQVPGVRCQVPGVRCQVGKNLPPHTTYYLPHTDTRLQPLAPRLSAARTYGWASTPRCERVCRISSPTVAALARTKARMEGPAPLRHMPRTSARLVLSTYVKPGTKAAR